MIVLHNCSFFAHMLVLSACSDFFMKNRDNLSATFNDFEYPVINAILKYCYLGEMCIDNKHIEKFMELAKKLEIKSIDPRLETIDFTNCLEALCLTDDPILRNKAIILTANNFKILHKSPYFLSLPILTIAKIVKSVELSVSAEEIFKAVKLWVNFDKANRRPGLVELLSFVKLPLLSIELLVTEVVDLCSSSPECIAIFQQVMKSILPDFQKKRLHGKKNKIALVGAEYIYTTNNIDVYDGRNDSWSLSEDFQFNTYNLASVLVDDWILIIGGSKFNAVTSVDYIDLTDGQKHQLKPLNQARCSFSAVTLSNDLSTDVYVIGGLANWKYLSSVERWNSKTKNWDMKVAPLLQGVCFHSASVIDDRIYVTGGVIYKDEIETSTNEVQMYSVEFNSWSYRAPMIQKRRGSSSIAIKGKLFVAGGYYYETNLYLDSIERYDPDADLWTDYCKLPNPVYGVSLCCFRNKLLCMGGYEVHIGAVSNVWEFDEATKSWKALKSLSNSRYYAVALVIPQDSII
ncbi:kelch-like protein 23 [Arctopsyche grandis]|uniref:kelch-like protein 23 n=1 Tax=Arctopsyche grandis TaxID=121162 RepID=UPI00406D7461